MCHNMKNFLIVFLFLYLRSNGSHGQSLPENYSINLISHNETKGADLFKTDLTQAANPTSPAKNQNGVDQNSTDDQIIAEQQAVTEKIQYVSVNSSDESSSEEASSEESSSEENTELSGRRFGHIVGGQITNIEEYPFIVSLQFQRSHICGGSLIKRNWILTAAHCLDGFKYTDFGILAGESDAAPDKLSGNAQLIPVKASIIHKNYDDTLVLNDIGLLMTAREFDLTDSVKLIKIATPDMNRHRDATELSDECTVIGWGDTRQQRRFRQGNLLRSVKLPLIALMKCAKAAPDFLLTPKQLCTMYAKGGKDSCMGDSGGPLVWKQNDEYVLQGLVSYGEGCARPNMPGIYTRVDAYWGWIINHMREPKQKDTKDGKSNRLEPTEVITCLILIFFYRAVNGI